MPYTYGSNDGNSTSDIVNSKLVVMFGNNPAETRMRGGGITYHLEQAREISNAKMIVIDPRYTDTARVAKINGFRSVRAPTPHW
ncbi:molybdopterin-dependent oxidoreductase [Hafnia alvei]|nr:molybdopterin-dependent oxidoreductase [Hafnia alvei]